jgi:hypothetical protein
LCTRWMQLGAFYPFMRNHNDLWEKVELFFLFFDDWFPVHENIGSRSSIIFMGSSTNNERSIAYAIFINSIVVYTSLWSNNIFKNCCSTTFLWVRIHHSKKKKKFSYSKFRYPDDETVYNIDQQFLIGRALLVSPNLQSVNWSIWKWMKVLIFIH